ncbi:MAG: acetylornithine deacetylase [Burkholderiaceae bacterium]|jgi:acetylornithine deacetylase|nr:acetylornithine deacetylase [Burkholderiaceae bacterium]
MNKPLPTAALAPSPEALAMIDRLIAFPTVSRDSNLGLIEFARDYLAGLGLRPHLVYDVERKKANLFVTLADDADSVHSGGIVLSGHTDTVPVDGQDWASDPFRAHHADGRIHGRGTADMKGFIAIALAWAPRFLAAQQTMPVHLALTYDEETTFLGVRGLVADLADRGIRPAGCIIGEPTDMRAIVAHKGKRDFCCTVRGREAHSSLTPTAVNAIEYAAQLIAFIRALADRQAREEPRDERFAVPYSTLQTGVIRGGIATNVVPRDCAFEFEMRNTPATSHDALTQPILDFARGELLPRMRAVAPESDIAFAMGLDLPAYGIADDAPLVRWAMELAQTARLGTGAVSFATEAPVFQHAGIPTVVLGPGSIDQAHKPNEYITLEQVAACEQFFARLVASRPPAG